MTNKVIEEGGFKYFKCKKCGEVKPLNKCYFHINTMFSTGFNSKCKSCVKEERENKPKVKYISRAELEEENKKLKSDLHFERNVLDNVGAEYDSLQNVIKKLEEEVEVWKNANKILRMHDAKMEYENKKLKEELEWYKKHYEHEIDKQVLKGFGCEIVNED